MVLSGSMAKTTSVRIKKSRKLNRNLSSEIVQNKVAGKSGESNNVSMFTLTEEEKNKNTQQSANYWPRSGSLGPVKRL